MLLPFTPILAALSASAPIYKGMLSDNDMRWTVISQSVDDRNDDERNPESENHVPKSRYSTVNQYISNHSYSKDKYNDAIPYKPNTSHIEYLKREGGLDDKLAFHIASLFVRDPIPTYDHEHNQSLVNDRETLAHFENL
jgi:glutamate--cysteine ligase catalytic subunit